jgi:hypothetical protein
MSATFSIRHTVSMKPVGQFLWRGCAGKRKEEIALATDASLGSGFLSAPAM